MTTRKAFACLVAATGLWLARDAWAFCSCDPCPTPPLETADILTLGADVLPSTAPLSVGV
jgi:hypothetical protein